MRPKLTIKSAWADHRLILTGRGAGRPPLTLDHAYTREALEDNLARLRGCRSRKEVRSWLRWADFSRLGERALHG